MAGAMDSDRRIDEYFIGCINLPKIILLTWILLFAIKN